MSWREPPLDPPEYGETEGQQEARELHEEREFDRWKDRYINNDYPMIKRYEE